MVWCGLFFGESDYINSPCRSIIYLERSTAPNFGVNFTTLAPGSISALKHYHSKQDEFIYIISGTPILVYGDDEFLMSPGDCFGFKANSCVAHQLVNRTSSDVTYIEVGDRTPADSVEYPEDDLAFVQKADGAWSVSHKDGSPY